MIFKKSWRIFVVEATIPYLSDTAPSLYQVIFLSSLNKKKRTYVR